MDKKCYQSDHSISALSNDCIEMHECLSASNPVMIFHLSFVLRGGIYTQLLHASRGCPSAIDGSIPWLMN